MKENRHPRHSHYYIEGGILWESYRKSRGDLSYQWIMAVDLPDSDKITSEQIKEIFYEKEP